MKLYAFCLFWACSLIGADLVTATGPRTEEFRIDPYFESGAGISLATSRSSQFALAPGGLRLGTVGTTLNFAGANLNATLRWGAQIPGDVREYPGNVIKHRYRSVELLSVYPNIDFEFTFVPEGKWLLRIKCQGQCNLGQVRFEFPQAEVVLSSVPTLLIRRDVNPRTDAPLEFKMLSGGAFLTDNSKTVTIAAEGATVDILHTGPPAVAGSSLTLKDAKGNVYMGFGIYDDFGAPDPYPNERYRGCRPGIVIPIPCADIALAKFSSAGELQYITQIRAGRTESIDTIRQTPEGQLLLFGTTNSSDFPTTPNSYQPKYAGPEFQNRNSNNPPDGDLWLARLDPESGSITAATYLGGPQGDTARLEVAPDGSIEVLPVLFNRQASGLPTTAGALVPSCTDPCSRSWAARLSSNLGTLIYGTYLPEGTVATAIHSDASLYFVGYSGGGFPVTPGAYKLTPEGAADAFVGRLDPLGRRLIFGTYVGGPGFDGASSLVVAPDASVWFEIGAGPDSRRFVRISNDGTKALANIPTTAGQFVIDRSGVLHTIFSVPIGAGECGKRYRRYDDRGTMLTDLSAPGNNNFSFTNLEENLQPVIQIENSYYRYDPNAIRSVYLGCVLSPTKFTYAYTIAPGKIITLFGEKLGPAATKVFVNGWEAPVLYNSEKQLNIQIPFELQTGQPAEFEVEAGGAKSRILRVDAVKPTKVELFQVVLNEDGAVNSAQNPARKGSIVVLWATGAGQTDPTSLTGEVTPLALRKLTHPHIVRSVEVVQEILYQGAAPGATSGLNQINIRLNPSTRIDPSTPLGSTWISVDPNRDLSSDADYVLVYYR